MKPTLKKVSKYENKFAKLQKKAAEFNFRNQLKVVKKKEFTLEEEDKEVFFRQTLMYWNESNTYLTNFAIFITEKAWLVETKRREKGKRRSRGWCMINTTYL